MKGQPGSVGLVITAAGFLLLALALVLAGWTSPFDLSLSQSTQYLLWGMMGLSLVFIGVMIAATQYLADRSKN